MSRTGMSTTTARTARHLSAPSGRRRAAVAAAVLTLVPALTLTACGGSSSSKHSSEPGTSPGTAPVSPGSGGSTGGTSSTGSGTRSGARSTAPGPTATVPTSSTVTQAPVPVKSTATFKPKVTAKIVQVRSVNAKANLPGEIAGPAVAVTIELHNGTAKALAIEAVVNLYYGPSRTPATTIDGPPTAPFASSLAAGKTARGTYTFTLKQSQRSQVRVEFSYSGTSATVLFDGSLG